MTDNSRTLTEAELDSVTGGTSQFIAACVAAIYNAISASAQCTAADGKVVCQNTPK